MDLTPIYDLIEEVARRHARDPRVTLFEIGAEYDGPVLVLYGVTSEPAAAEALHRAAADFDPDLAIRDEVLRLPREEDGFLAHALVRVASAPLLAGPLISETPLSQVVLGMRMLVLREHGRWLQVRASDGYIGWIHRGYLTRLTESEARAWELGVDAPLHFSLGAEVLDGGGALLMRIPWGARAAVGADGVRLPDGSRGRLRGETVPVAELPGRFPPDGEAIVRTATEWMGTPYFWGGITPAGADCSGLVQAVYRAHGIELPRDSDMQARCGDPIDPGRDFADLLSGDLLFFAEYGDRVSHVAISRGGSKIIHSALGNGGVRMNDLAGDHGSERELRSLFVCARRLLSS